MLEEKIELFIITYNRAKYLDYTLKKIKESPFSKCKITVLDNCSEDETPHICAKYQNLLSNIKIIRHKKNIGSSPNYLRAVELSNSEYTWILCDDDKLDFSECSDVINTIEKGDHDIILVGAETQYEWERGMDTTTLELLNKGAKYFSTLGFIPSTIFKTELYDSKCIFKGYYNVMNIYPHFPFINKTVEENCSVYISKKTMIYWGNDEIPGFPEINILIGWLNCCQDIKDKNIRKKAIEGSVHYGGVMGISHAITMEKLRKNGRTPSQIILPFLQAFITNFGYSLDQLPLLVMIPLSLTPSFIIKSLVKLLVYYKYDFKGKDVPEKTKIYLYDEERIKRLH
jgi:glycosyltransferase involved in cell wall biosynthesis